MDNEQIQAQIRELQQQLGTLSQKVFSQQVDRNMPVEQQDMLQEIISDRIADISWNEYLHYTTLFDTLDSTEDSGASVAANRLFMSASGTGTVAYTRLRRVYQNIFSFGEESRFRTAIHTGSSSLNTGDEMEDVEAYAGTGSSGTGSSHIFGNGLADNSHYGFYIQDNALYGITSNGSNYTTTLLSDVNVYDLFFVEAVHIPSERVDFYVSEPSNAITDPEVKPAIFRGSISSTLPTGVRKPVYEFAVKNSDGATGNKDFNIGFYETLQKK